jgi:hypothetical protein
MPWQLTSSSVNLGYYFVGVVLIAFANRATGGATTAAQPRG